MSVSVCLSQALYFLCDLKMKLPGSVGQKKIKAIEQILVDQGVGEWETCPFATDAWRGTYKLTFYWKWRHTCILGRSKLYFKFADVWSAERLHYQTSCHIPWIICASFLLKLVN